MFYNSIRITHFDYGSLLSIIAVLLVVVIKSLKNHEHSSRSVTVIAIWSNQLKTYSNFTQNWFCII